MRTELVYRNQYVAVAKAIAGRELGKRGRGDDVRRMLMPPIQ
ncbi:hypothetical protein RR48_12700 [Papilio machaon]|uniref:Uncharacterized protein n=1 Tax=Papilio machaon TaxID=76193 RepID=A0A194QQS6_PAPMA|nr:hypothetical protein RR48_12700 [Papilio machaon]